jgi:hypothetical protein
MVTRNPSASIWWAGRRACVPGGAVGTRRRRRARPFATVRHRTKVTKGPASRAAGLAMSFKLVESAQARWWAVNAPQLVAFVRNGAKFVNGELFERTDDLAPPTAA